MTRHRKLVVLDVDSTLTRDEGIDLLASFVSEDVASQVAAITAAAMRGELDFEESLKRRVATLEGVSVEAVAAATAQVRVTEGARELVSELHAHGHLVPCMVGARGCYERSGRAGRTRQPRLQSVPCSLFRWDRTSEVPLQEAVDALLHEFPVLQAATSHRSVYNQAYCSTA